MVGFQLEGESIGGPGPVEERKKEELWVRDRCSERGEFANGSGEFSQEEGEAE